ncbi:immunoglobulin-like domain-containing protein [Treponema sp.]|uniref:immunoglobulin-like domain-containing protein n=1 Tax=Treponema sp. TaxID=166 RepID=UPI00388D46BF
MKKFIKTFALLSSFTMLFGFASCADSGDSSGNQTASVNQNDSLSLVSAYDSLTIAEEIAGTSISLPSGVSGYDDVTVTWESAEPGIIEAATGTVTAKDGSEYDLVTLTATLKNEKGKTLTKVFTVKVYQNSALLDEEAVLNLAFIQLKSILTSPVYAWSETEFDGKITIRDSEVSVNLETDNTEAVVIENSKITIYRNIYDIPVNITAELTCGTASKTETVALNLPAVTKFVSVKTGSYTNSDYVKTRTLILDPSTGTFDYLYVTEETYTSGDNAGSTETDKDGMKGTYVLSEDGKNITLTVNKILLPELTGTDTYYTKQEFLDAMGKLYKEVFKAMKAYEEKQTMNTAYTFMKSIYAVNGGTFTGADFESYVCEQFNLNSYAEITEEQKEMFLAGVTVEEKEEKYDAAQAFGVTDFVELPLKQVLTSLQAFESKQTIDNAVAFMVANNLDNGTAITKASYEESVCKLYSFESIADFEKDENAETKAVYLTEIGKTASSVKENLLTALNLDADSSWSKINSAYSTENTNLWNAIISGSDEVIKKVFNVDWWYYTDVLSTFEIDYQDLTDENYSVRAGIIISSVYDSSKKWYEQTGNYFGNTYSYAVYLGSGYLKFNGSYYYFDEGEWNDDYSQFIWTDSDTSETKTFTFTDNGETVTVTCGSQSAEITFHSTSILEL